MDSLLEPVSSIRLHRDPSREPLHRDPSRDPPKATLPDPQTLKSGSSHTDLDILKSGPSLPELDSLLTRLMVDDEILKPSAKTAQLVHLLVTEIVPTFWPTQQVRLRIVACLQSTLGCGCILQQLKVQPAATATWLDLLEHVLATLSLIKVWRTGLVAWQETVALFGSGRVVSLVAEASHRQSWISHGKRYAKWLGRNLRSFISEASGPEWPAASKAVVRLLSKALSLGYKDPLIQHAVFGLPPLRLRLLLSDMTFSDRRSILYSFIHLTSRPKFASFENQLRLLAQGEILSGWLSDTPLPAAQYDHSIHCCVIQALDPDTTKSTFDRCLETFGDKLSIKHSPVLQQEVNTQILLLLARRILDSEADFLVSISQSKVYLNAISDHLAASSPQVRFLGMVVGSIVSEKVDPPDRRLNFEPEGNWDWYRGLVLGPNPTQKVAPEIVKVDKVEEIDSDDDLPVYAVPASAPDHEDDAELVRRDKAVPPVYIRELLAGLRNSENFDQHRLALVEAPLLIRRKADFGSELLDHLDALAAALLGLDDRWEMENFAELKSQAMIALVESAPQQMGPYFARAFYTGDFSLGQRVTILIAMGLGARQLAGGKIALFPSKRLPELRPSTRKFSSYQKDGVEWARNQSSLPEKKMDDAYEAVETSILQPLALRAADEASGPNVLKVRTFSSRMAVERRQVQPSVNRLAKIAAEAFLFPLVGRFQISLVGRNAPQASPMLLSHFLKTIAIILHAAGPTCHALLQISQELGALFFEIRRSSMAQDVLVLEALLFATLSLLEINPEDTTQTKAWAGQLLETEMNKRCQMLAAAILMFESHTATAIR